MDPTTSLTTVALILAAMAVIALLEVALPLHPRESRHRAHLGPNLALTFITFGTNIFLNSALLLLIVWLQGHGIGVLRWLPLPGLAADIIAVIALDYSFYVAHRATHKFPLLWRVHRVHHSDPVVDVTTTIRQHPLDGVIRYASMAAFAGFFGVSPGSFVVYRVWSALSGLLQHANLRVPRWLDRMLVLVTTWPNMHKVHHSRDVAETDTNFGNIFPWFDWLFGTYTSSSRGETVNSGLQGGFDHPSAQTTAGLLAMPFKDAWGPEQGVAPSGATAARPSA